VFHQILHRIFAYRERHECVSALNLLEPFFQLVILCCFVFVTVQKGDHVGNVLVQHSSAEKEMPNKTAEENQNQQKQLQ